MYGGTNDVDSVMPIPMCLVKAPMIGTRVAGSCTGNWPAYLTTGSELPLYVVYGASSSAMNIASNSPRSMMRPRSRQYSGRDQW